MAGPTPRAPTGEERAELLRSFRCTPRIEDAYPWSHIATEAAVWLRDAGCITEAKAIGEVLSGLPTGPVDGNQPEILTAQFDAIRDGAKRVCAILADFLAGGTQPKKAKRRKRTRNPALGKRLTDRQREAVETVSKCGGNISAAARLLARDPATVRQHYRAGMEKLGQAIVEGKGPRPKTQALPTDNRGQECI